MKTVIQFQITLQIFPQEDSVTDTEPDSGEVPGGAEGKNSEMPGSENREMQGKSKSENRETSDEPESEYREESENAYYMTPGTEAGSAYQGEYGGGRRNSGREPPHRKKSRKQLQNMKRQSEKARIL